MYIWSAFKNKLIAKFLFYLNILFFRIILIYNMSTFLFHPPGITVKIIGMDCSPHGRSCYAHHFCGSLLTLDVAVRFRRLQILDNGKESSFFMAYHVTDGINSCCVGFLKRELTKFSSLYNGVLAQVSSIRPGSSVAVIISCLPEETIRQITINRVIKYIFLLFIK